MQHRLSWIRKILPNGPRILLYPKPQANTVQLSVAVEYGSNHDTNDKAGLAHFVEHMLAGGSSKRIQTSREVERLGGLSDFYTDLEYTMSQFSLMPEKLANAAQIMANLLFKLPFEEPQFAKEQKIILTELDEVADDPFAKTDELLLKSLFKTHPVRNPVGGFRKTVTKLALKDVAEAYEHHFAPQNMILILTGNFTESDIEGQLRGFAGDCDKQVGAKTKNPAETRKPTKQLVREKAGICQSYLRLGAKTVPSRHPDAVVLNLIDTLLGEGASSRLLIELREKRALTYGIRSSHEYGVDFGYFIIDCAVKEKNLAKVQDLIHKELAKLRTEKITRAELEKGKNIILGDIYRIMDSSCSCADALAFMEIQFNSENALVDYTEKIKAVTVNDVMRIAESYLEEEKFSTVILKPKRAR